MRLHSEWEASFEKFAAVLSLVAGFVTLVPALGQHKSDPRNVYERLFCVVPMIGKGTLDDPKRPMFAPAPADFQKNPGEGILAFHFQPSDDGRFALVEFVAINASAFQSIVADATVKSFKKGKDSKEDIEKEFKKLKKDFRFDDFGMVAGR